MHGPAAGFWTQSSKPAPPAGEDTPDTWEHSVEVQVPFLQKTLTNFTILPVVFGEVDPEQAARVLAGVIDDKTFVVASSDLSHYYTYDKAEELDHRCVKAICDMNIDEMKTQEGLRQTAHFGADVSGPGKRLENAIAGLPQQR